MHYFLIVVTIIARFLPHPFNVTPIGALGLFAGTYSPPRWAWLVPLLAMFVGDAVNGFYHWVVLVFVYLGMLAGPLMGYWMLRGKFSLARLVMAVPSAAVLFYLVSNFGVWVSGIGYPITLAGLAECYLNGLPYLLRSVIGDACYAALFFGVFHLVKFVYDMHRSRTA